MANGLANPHFHAPSVRKAVSLKLLVFQLSQGLPALPELTRRVRGAWEREASIDVDYVYTRIRQNTCLTSKTPILRVVCTQHTRSINSAI